MGFFFSYAMLHVGIQFITIFYSVNFIKTLENVKYQFKYCTYTVLFKMYTYLECEISTGKKCKLV